MSITNKVFILGNLGQDPETRILESGVSVTKISVATNERYKDKEGNKATHTEWHNVQLWRGLSEVASKYLKKGSKVAISGMLRTRSWEDNNGVKRYSTDVIAQELKLLDSGGGNSDNKFKNLEEPPSMQSFPPASAKTEEIGVELEDDDLPF